MLETNIILPKASNKHDLDLCELPVKRISLMQFWESLETVQLLFGSAKLFPGMKLILN